MSLCGLFTCVYFVNQLYILYHILIINFRLWYEGTPKYLEGVSQTWNLGYGNDDMVYT